MKIATRLTILLIVLTTMVALTVGWFAVEASTRSLYSTLDNQINAVIHSGVGNPNVALTNALNVVQENSYDLTLDVVDPSGVVVQVNTPDSATSKEPDPRATHWRRSAAVSVAVEPAGLSNPFDLRRRRRLPGRRRFDGRHHPNRDGDWHLDVALTGFLVALVMLVLARLVMRKDLRTMEHLIGFASGVARGEERGEIPPSAGSRDVRELQAALATMVVALHERIAIESEERRSDAAVRRRRVARTAHARSRSSRATTNS